MGKDSIRDILPPTTRNFEDRTDRLGNQAKHLQARLDAVDGHLSGIDQSLERMDVQLDGVAAYMRYGNIEYAQFASLEFLEQASLGNRSPRILIAGWYGAENLGDELMMQTVLNYLPERLYERTTVLLWDNLQYPLWKLDPRIKVIHYPNTLWDIQALSRMFDVLIWGGGALLDDVQYDACVSNFNTGNLFIRLSKKMLGLDKKVYCIGLSSNQELEDPGYCRELEYIIDASEHFSLRDVYSLETLEKAGIDTTRVGITHDIAFANEQLAWLGSAERKSLSDDARSRDALGMVLFCLDDLIGFNEQLLEDTVEHAGLQGEEEYPGGILLIPFYNENGHDTAYLERLRERFLAKHDTCSVDITIGAYMEDFRKSPLLDCRFVISSRYHASLIAGCLGISFVSVCNDKHRHYQNKTAFLLETLFPNKEGESPCDICVSGYSKEQLFRHIESAKDRICDVGIIEKLFKEESDLLRSLLGSIG